MKKTYYKITEITDRYGFSKTFIVECIRKEWIFPYNPEEELLDEEDVARVRLISQLRDNFEVNDAAVPIILSLIDQIHALKSRLYYYSRQEPDENNEIS